MTKAELIKALANFPDDADVVVAWTCKGCGTTLEGISSVDENGGAQLTTESLASFIDQGYRDNLQQNAKVTARAEGIVDQKEWEDCQKPSTDPVPMYKRPRKRRK